MGVLGYNAGSCPGRAAPADAVQRTGYECQGAQAIIQRPALPGMLLCVIAALSSSMQHACNSPSGQICRPTFLHGVQVKRVMNHELPPMKFWWWWCGGLKTYDALIVAGYLIVNVLYVEQRYTLYLAGLLRALWRPHDCDFCPWLIHVTQTLWSCHAAALRKGHGELSGWNYQQSMFST